MHRPQRKHLWARDKKNRYTYTYDTGLNIPFQIINSFMVIRNIASGMHFHDLPSCIKSPEQRQIPTISHWIPIKSHETIIEPLRIPWNLHQTPKKSMKKHDTSHETTIKTSKKTMKTWPCRLVSWSLVVASSMAARVVALGATNAWCTTAGKAARAWWWGRREMAHGGEKSTKTKGFAYWRWGFTY